MNNNNQVADEELAHGLLQKINYDKHLKVYSLRVLSDENIRQQVMEEEEEEQLGGENGSNNGVKEFDDEYSSSSEENKSGQPQDADEQSISLHSSHHEET